MDGGRCSIPVTYSTVLELCECRRGYGGSRDGGTRDDVLDAKMSSKFKEIQAHRSVKHPMYEKL